MIHVVGETTIWSNEGADVIIAVGFNAVFGFLAGLMEVFGFPAGLQWAYVGIVVALRVTLLCYHEMCLFIVRTSPSCIFTSSVSPWESRKVSPIILQM